ncbi:hypothetical protein HDV05_004142 [Chytridiales sp. JEL 0842]|nr:hypothetical protein HDV05_004142 [Chytridiales sp. JEL 0842]
MGVQVSKALLRSTTHASIFMASNSKKMRIMGCHSSRLRRAAIPHFAQDVTRSVPKEFPISIACRPCLPPTQTAFKHPYSYPVGVSQLLAYALLNPSIRVSFDTQSGICLITSVVMAPGKKQSTTSCIKSSTEAIRTMSPPQSSRHTKQQPTLITAPSVKSAMSTTPRNSKSSKGAASANGGASGWKSSTAIPSISIINQTKQRRPPLDNDLFSALPLQNHSTGKMKNGRKRSGIPVPRSSHQGKASSEDSDNDGDVDEYEEERTPKVSLNNQSPERANGFTVNGPPPIHGPTGIPALVGDFYHSTPLPESDSHHCTPTPLATYTTSYIPRRSRRSNNSTSIDGRKSISKATGSKLLRSFEKETEEEMWNVDSSASSWTTTQTNTPEESDVEPFKTCSETSSPFVERKEPDSGFQSRNISPQTKGTASVVVSAGFLVDEDVVTSPVRTIEARDSAISLGRQKEEEGEEASVCETVDSARSETVEDDVKEVTVVEEEFEERRKAASPQPSLETPTEDSAPPTPHPTTETTSTAPTHDDNSTPTSETTLITTSPSTTVELPAPLSKALSLIDTLWDSSVSLTANSILFVSRGLIKKPAKWVLGSMERIATKAVVISCAQAEVRGLGISRAASPERGRY